MLSTVIDLGPYEQKPVPGTIRKLVSLLDAQRAMSLLPLPPASDGRLARRSS